MTIEFASLGLTALVLVMQGVNMYTTASLKAWSLKEFVSKSDFMDLLELWNTKK